MDRLSSCYFCGAALDASLDEYPVVPPTLRPDAETRKTVVLCPTCRRKLDAVLESVAEAVEGSGLDEVADTLGDEDVLRPVGTGKSAGSDADDGRSADGPTEPESDAGGERRDRDDQPWISGEEISDGSEAESADPTAASAESSAESGAADDGQSGESGTERSDDGANAEQATPGESSGPSDGSDGAKSESDAASRDDQSKSDQTEETGSGGSSGSAELSDAKLTRLENTKVMRLLQNREFPVDKEEFVTVATNAYDISRSDCEKILELAVQHDLLDEEDGQLFAGDR